MIWANSSLEVPNNYLGSAIFTSCFEISGAVAELSVLYRFTITQTFINITIIYVPSWLGLHSGVYAGVSDP